MEKVVANQFMQQLMTLQQISISTNSTDADDHPTPDNMWDFSSVETPCDWVCGTFTVLSTLTMFSHMFIMAMPLSGWANGNLFLMFNTVQTLVQYINFTALVWSPEWYWNLSGSVRKTAFAFALFHFVFWISTFIAEWFKSNDRELRFETNYQILSAYLITIDIPKALLSLGTIVLASASGEMSPNGVPIHNRNKDPEEVPEEDIPQP